jgi:hypothetical protein
VSMAPQNRAARRSLARQIVKRGGASAHQVREARRIFSAVLLREPSGVFPQARPKPWTPDGIRDRARRLFRR